ncbi:hypothetical protein F4811DRAFT_529799 [Daldinia bambusicola]|nr:hypothetical protein F4811DRAFT_529799 [Daldinia bambusicola]
MKAVASLLTFTLVTLTAAIAPRAEPPPGPWTAKVWRDDIVSFRGVLMNASGGKFWMNKAASAECPSDIENLDCTKYPGTETIFNGGNETIFLNVGVPGGQQVYIAEDGALSFTTPHSGQIPDGGVATGFSRVLGKALGAPVMLSNANGDWYICPVGEGEPQEKVYQLYVGETDKEGCYSAHVRTYQPKGGDVWEYV